MDVKYVGHFSYRTMHILRAASKQPQKVCARTSRTDLGMYSTSRHVLRQKWISKFFKICRCTNVHTIDIYGIIRVSLKQTPLGQNEQKESKKHIMETTVPTYLLALYVDGPISPPPQKKSCRSYRNKTTNFRNYFDFYLNKIASTNKLRKINFLFSTSRRKGTE